MQTHFVTFLMPGPFVATKIRRPIGSWDVEEARQMAATLRNTRGDGPYAFYFTTEECGYQVDDASPHYYLGGEIYTLGQVEARQDPSERVLLANMHGSGLEAVIQTAGRDSIIRPFRSSDHLLEAL